jgi:AcrR family transcriptional regulator
VRVGPPYNAAMTTDPTAPPAPGPRPGLRERKKAKTRAAIREHAFRLVRAQGYAATTVEQIADAAEISPSTFFRYFPTKEDALLYDPYDPVLEAAFAAQPRELSAVGAMRAAIREGFGQLPRDEVAAMTDLLDLLLTTPALRARLLDEMGRSARQLAAMAAARAGKPADDPGAVVFAWTCVGAVFGAMSVAAGNPDADLAALIDDALARLEAGLPV